MSTPAVKPVRIDPDPTVAGVEVSGTALRIMLSDGRELSALLAWFPRLANATPKLGFGHFRLGSMRLR